MDTTEEIGDGAFPWYIQEVQQLRDDVENLEQDRDHWITECTRFMHEGQILKTKYQALEEGTQERIRDGNKDLYTKAILYGDIILEYRKIVSQYAQHTGTILVTNNIKQMEKDGGISE